jgi:hypothetical protein
LKYIKRRRVGKEENTADESKLSDPSTSEAEKEVTGKEIQVYTELLGHGFYLDKRRKFPASIAHSLREEKCKIRLS